MVPRLLLDRPPGGVGRRKTGRRRYPVVPPAMPPPHLFLPLALLAAAPSTQEDDRPLVRYVRIELEGKRRTLSLAEVQVFLAGDNLAPGNQATQIDVSNEAPAERAVDGSTHGDFKGGSVTHTTETSDPWWELDLGLETVLDQVTVWNRTDCCGERLDGFTLRLLDGAREEVWRREKIPAPRPRADFLPWGGELADHRVPAAEKLKLQPRINDAIDRGVAYLRSVQLRDGSWAHEAPNYRAGQTGLSVYTLLKSGVPAAHPAVAQGLEYLRVNRPVKTYSMGCCLLALGAAELDRDLPLMEAIVRDLLATPGPERRRRPRRSALELPGHALPPGRPVQLTVRRPRPVGGGHARHPDPAQGLGRDPGGHPALSGEAARDPALGLPRDAPRGRRPRGGRLQLPRGPEADGLDDRRRPGDPGHRPRGPGGGPAARPGSGGRALRGPGPGLARPSLLGGGEPRQGGLLARLLPLWPRACRRPVRAEHHRRPRVVLGGGPGHPQAPEGRRQLEGPAGDLLRPAVPRARHRSTQRGSAPRGPLHGGGQGQPGALPRYRPGHGHLLGHRLLGGRALQAGGQGPAGPAGPAGRVPGRRSGGGDGAGRRRRVVAGRALPLSVHLPRPGRVPRDRAG